MFESESRPQGSWAAPFRLAPLLALAATVLALTACGQAPAPADVAVADTGSSSGSSTSDGGVDVDGPVNIEVEVFGGGTAGGADEGSAPTEVTTEQITEPVVVLEVSTDSGRVTVLGSDDPAVTVVRRIYREPDAPGELFRHLNGVLHFDAKCRVDSPRGPCRIDYEVTVPRGTAVKINSASGDLAATGMSGSLAARSASGSVALDEHRSANTVAESASGDVEVRLAERPESVDASSVSGDVRVVVSDAGPYRVDTSTVTGDVDVDVPTDPGADSAISAGATSGDVTVSTS